MVVEVYKIPDTDERLPGQPVKKCAYCDCPLFPGLTVRVYNQKQWQCFKHSQGIPVFKDVPELEMDKRLLEQWTKDKRAFLSQKHPGRNYDLPSKLQRTRGRSGIIEIDSDEEDLLIMNEDSEGEQDGYVFDIPTDIREDEEQPQFRALLPVAPELSAKDERSIFDLDEAVFHNIKCQNVAGDLTLKMVLPENSNFSNRKSFPKTKNWAHLSSYGFYGYKLFCSLRTNDAFADTEVNDYCYNSEIVVNEDNSLLQITVPVDCEYPTYQLTDIAFIDKSLDAYGRPDLKLFLRVIAVKNIIDKQPNEMKEEDALILTAAFNGYIAELHSHLINEPYDKL
ncbi:hypothetical protein PCE1_001068 [Barthelona sp. PCE]